MLVRRPIRSEKSPNGSPKTSAAMGVDERIKPSISLLKPRERIYRLKNSSHTLKDNPYSSEEIRKSLVFRVNLARIAIDYL